MFFIGGLIVDGFSVGLLPNSDENGEHPGVRKGK